MGFWEDLSLQLEDDVFRWFFRMNRQTLRALTSFLKPVTRIYQGGREQVGPAKMVAVTVCFLGSQMPFKQLSNMFGISEGCLIKVTDYIMQLLVHKSHLVIKWPNKEDYDEIAAEFNKRRIRYFVQFLKNKFISCLIEKYIYKNTYQCSKYFL